MSNRPLRWLELAVCAHAEAVEAVSEILDRVGYNGIAVDQPLEPGIGADHVVKAYLVYDGAARIRVRRVREALGHLQAFGLGPVGALSVRRIEDEDWLEAWKASVTPVRAGPFLVRPTWSDAGADGAVVLSLDPGMAFGTGLHPTTQQCLERIGALDLAGRALLDVGTGSGILAIAAAKRGAARVVGVDDDPVAIRAAVENVARNAVAVEVALGSAADVPGTFDLVVANIVAPVLVAIAPALRARLAPGGALVLAGVTLGREAEVVAAFRAAGLAAAERDRRDDWVCLVLR
ncbi:MAG TPA: 50S ribosomal protein L11 methyltransferase [Candidatus Limnocylindrales bacterium]|nr:50S ribosomal protein L11 methyltransferase [Candidatus Limnocylindrales bacterium]